MASVRFFHEIYGNVHELPDRGPFPYERGLQEYCEKHLRILIGAEFLDSEYSTGQHHSRRIDTLGIDGTGRPVVVEYKRHQDDNVINQGLDYLDWLDGHQAEFRELVRERLGDRRVGDIDFRTPRLLCIAGDFLRQDKIAARDSRRHIELVRYRRYGDAFVALEWVYGGETIERTPQPIVSRPPGTADQGSSSVSTNPAASSPGAGEDLDYSIYEPWGKTSEETRALFRQLRTLVASMGSVRTDAFRNEMSFKCTAVRRSRPPVIAYVHLRTRDGIRVHVLERHLHGIPLEDGFTRPYDRSVYREIIIRNKEHVQKAEPLLRAAYDSLSGSRAHADSPRSLAARKAWATRRST